MENEINIKSNSLKNRIWNTYKARINSAERLKVTNNYVRFLSIYYSSVLAAISIINFYLESKIIDLFSIVLSIMVTILFLYFDGRNYKERYIKMKENYNNINMLYYKIDPKIDLTEKEYLDYSEEYIKLLNDVENHLEKDYIKYIIKDKNINKSFSMYLKYYFILLIEIMFKIFLFICPTILLFISSFKVLF